LRFLCVLCRLLVVVAVEELAAVAEVAVELVQVELGQHRPVGVVCRVAAVVSSEFHREPFSLVAVASSRHLADLSNSACPYLQ
jgi:hypothetical protein